MQDLGYELPRIPKRRSSQNSYSTMFVNKAAASLIRARVPASSPQNQGGAARRSTRGVC